MTLSNIEEKEMLQQAFTRCVGIMNYREKEYGVGKSEPYVVPSPEYHLRMIEFFQTQS